MTRKRLGKVFEFIQTNNGLVIGIVGRGGEGGKEVCNCIVSGFSKAGVVAIAVGLSPLFTCAIVSFVRFTSSVGNKAVQKVEEITGRKSHFVEDVVCHRKVSLKIFFVWKTKMWNNRQIHMGEATHSNSTESMMKFFFKGEENV